MMAYIVKSTLMLSLFYLFFILFMKKTTFFRFNRVMLMAGSCICMLLPLFDLSYLQISFLNDIPHLELPHSPVPGNAGGESGGWNWIAVLTAIYLAGVGVVMACCVISISRTLAICRRGEIVCRDGVVITVTEDNAASFSFFRHIVLSREDYQQNPVVLQHEMMHVRCCHSLGVILFSIVSALHWFNPLVWMARNVLREMQEYEADEAVLNQGVDATQYQMLLVRKAVGAERFRMANGFNHTKLKNRIAMMQAKKTGRTVRFAYLACLPLILSVLCFCTEAGCSFRKIDEMALFNGEDPGGFSRWVMEQLASSGITGIHDMNGRVIASFTIDTKGKLANPRIVRGLSDDADREVLRILSSSPEWTPVRMKGKAVMCTFTFPVIFASK